MNLANQLLQYSEQERLALISCITSIATLDKVADEEEIDFILALVEAADLDAMKMKSVIDAARDPQNKILKNTVDVIASHENSRHFFTNEILPFIKYNNELSGQSHVQHILDKLDAYKKLGRSAILPADNHVELEGSFLEKVVLSLYLK
jgi:CMP-2-keto-3-deoxyoctulosonic acid synthetase